MTELMMRFSDTVSDERGTFQPCVMAHDRGDGTWEGWLEFASARTDEATMYITQVETHQRDRVTLERWASGLTHVYAEGALARAQVRSRPSS